MNCMKCGRETAEGQVFCSKCQELMAQHPVKPDVVIKLPQRQEISPRKPVPRKKSWNPEEQVLLLKRKNRWLTVIASLLLIFSLLLFSLCVDYFRQLDVQNLLGQNYSTVETAN